MEQNMVNTLVILGEERVSRRLAEDRVEALESALAEALTKIEGLEGQVESLTSEKGVLLVDIDNLTKKVEAAKEAGYDVAD